MRLTFNLTARRVLPRLGLYGRLIRFDKPIGTLLLLWPTLWGLWMASGGLPDFQILWRFAVGAFLVRSAACAINDWADREFDKHVKRTAHRPLAAEQLSEREALIIAAVLSIAALIVASPLNTATLLLALAAAAIAATYPFMKRFFCLPQAYLGIAYGFGIPMGFAAAQRGIPAVAWLLLLGNVFWSIAYDTAYAMVDRDDDMKIGIRTSAITFGRYDVSLIMACYMAFLGTMAAVGLHLALRPAYFWGLGLAGLITLYHYTLIRDRDRMRCFAAFRHNNWIGACVFAGTALSYVSR